MKIKFAIFNSNIEVNLTNILNTFDNRHFTEMC